MPALAGIGLFVVLPLFQAEIPADAEEIKDTPGEPVRYGFGASAYSWFFEQWVAGQGQTL